MSVVLLLVPLALVVAIGLVLAGAAARPWELSGLPWGGRLRIALALLGYDLWLDVHGVSARRRRGLRAKLRGNLWEAALRVGSRQAVADIASVRSLARAAAREPAGPAWGRGLAVGLLATTTVVMLELGAAVFWFEAARASGVMRVEGALGLFPGARASWVASDSFGMSVDLGPTALVIGVIVFAWVAGPWRAWNRRSPARTAA